MKQINLLVITSVISLLLCVKSFAADDLECSGRTVNSGTLTGTLVKLIDRDIWTTTNYIMQTDNGYYCIRHGDITNEIRGKIISNAFFLGSRITISLTKDHTITGIAIH